VACAVLFTVLLPAGFVVQRMLGIAPETGPEIYVALVIGFSLPTSTYFTFGDLRRTIGKRMLRLVTTSVDGRRIAPIRALGRTAVKLLPWEIAHISVFLLVPEPGELTLVSWIGLGLSYLLGFVYVGILFASRGRISAHDLILGTQVERSDTIEQTSFHHEPK
jgi:hypothetical protein